MTARNYTLHRTKTRTPRRRRAWRCRRNHTARTLHQPHVAQRGAGLGRNLRADSSPQRNDSHHRPPPYQNDTATSSKLRCPACPACALAPDHTAARAACRCDKQGGDRAGLPYGGLLCAGAEEGGERMNLRMFPTSHDSAPRNESLSWRARPACTRELPARLVAPHAVHAAPGAPRVLLRSRPLSLWFSALTASRDLCGDRTGAPRESCFLEVQEVAVFAAR